MISARRLRQQFAEHGWFGFDNSTSFSADKIPKVTSKNGINPMTRMAVNNPPAIAKPIEYSVSLVVHVSLLAAHDEHDQRAEEMP